VTFADLGVSPLANSYVRRDRSAEMEAFYPLHAFVCERCLLVQVEAFTSREAIFSHYAYFSSFSDSWLDHSRRFADLAIERLRLDGDALIVEAASNDGYLLQYFRDRGRRVLGIEPAANVGETARARGIPTETAFLGRRTAEDLCRVHGRAQLVVANNVIAHVPDLHDFLGGLAAMTAPGGTITVEFPHLSNLIDEVQFDTIYHEHFSYFSLYSMERVLERHDLRVIDAERLITHGGSLRLWIVRTSDPRAEEQRVETLRRDEASRGLDGLAVYRAFEGRVAKRKRDVLRFFLGAADDGKVVAGYGAPAKGNTLLNFCGIKTDMMPFTVDRNPEKQGTLLPGSRIPVFPPERIAQERPDYVFILPWNIRGEVTEQMASIREWGGRFVVGTRELEIV
jgi:SAM-dependent methyltransferase